MSLMTAKLDAQMTVRARTTRRQTPVSSPSPASSVLSSSASAISPLLASVDAGDAVLEGDSSEVESTEGFSESSGLALRSAVDVGGAQRCRNAGPTSAVSEPASNKSSRQRRIFSDFDFSGFGAVRSDVY